MTIPGTLYLCPTPIGNLEDMTFRAVRILKEAALIAAEDTRHTRKLLTHFDIHTPLISYHEHNKQERGEELVARLLAGDSLAVVSDAGMPGISDPGSDLAAQAIAAGVRVVPLPGPNAALTALIASGLDTTAFIFIGFLPKAKKKRQELLAALAGHPYTLVFYEAPHRLRASLRELEAALGDRQAVAGRELTKVFEEFVRDSISGIRQYFEAHQPRGEFTLIVAGKDRSGQCEAETEVPPADPVEAIAGLMAAGMDKKAAIKKIASEHGLSKRDLYQAALQIK